MLGTLISAFSKGSIVRTLLNKAISGIVNSKTPEEQAHHTTSANDIAALDAQGQSWLQRNWRPFIGWVLGVSAFFYFVPQFGVASYLWWKHSIAADEILPYPKVDNDQLFYLLTLMLGVVTIRGYEKYKHAQLQQKERLSKHETREQRKDNRHERREQRKDKRLKRKKLNKDGLTEENQ